MKRMSVAEAQQDLEKAIEAAERGEATIILRDGRAVAFVTPVQETSERPDLPKPRLPGGLLSAIGLLAEWETIVEDMDEVIAMRHKEFGRPPPEFD